LLGVKELNVKFRITGVSSDSPLDTHLLMVEVVTPTLRSIKVSAVCGRKDDGLLYIYQVGALSPHMTKLFKNTEGWEARLGVNGKDIYGAVEYTLKETNNLPPIRKEINKLVEQQVQIKDNDNLVIKVDGMECYWDNEACSLLEGTKHDWMCF